MLLTYTYVKGEAQLDKLLQKMGKHKPRFVESFAHVDNITIERIYARPDDCDGGYREYFILYMPHENGRWGMSSARKQVYEDIRSGDKNMRKV